MLSDIARNDLLHYYTASKGYLVHFDRDQNFSQGSLPIGQQCTPLSHALLDGRYVSGTGHSRRISAGNSIVKLTTPENGTYAGGEIRSIFLHQLLGKQPVIFAHIAWMEHINNSPVNGDPWADL